MAPNSLGELVDSAFFDENRNGVELLGREGICDIHGIVLMSLVLLQKRSEICWLSAARFVLEAFEVSREIHVIHLHLDLLWEGYHGSSRLRLLEVVARAEQQDPHCAVSAEAVDLLRIEIDREFDGVPIVLDDRQGTGLGDEVLEVEERVSAEVVDGDCLR